MASGSDRTIGLAELARQVREHTLQYLQLPAEWLIWSPPGTSNHILWHAGHALWVQDALTVEPLTGRSELPPGWVEIFGQDSKPASTPDWPDATYIGRCLEAQLTQVLTLLTDRADDIAERANQKPAAGGWPLLPGIIHGWHDEARHQGEMYLLFKLCRVREPG